MTISGRVVSAHLNHDKDSCVGYCHNHSSYSSPWVIILYGNVSDTCQQSGGGGTVFHLELREGWVTAVLKARQHSLCRSPSAHKHFRPSVQEVVRHTSKTTTWNSQFRMEASVRPRRSSTPSPAGVVLLWSCYCSKLSYHNSYYYYFAPAV